MTTPGRIYLDTNILYGWFKNQLNNKNIDPEIMKFLSEKCQKIEKYISVYVVAELIVNLKKDFQGRNISMDTIGHLFKILADTIGLITITENIKITKEIIAFTELCNDHNDAIHIEIAKSNNLTLITEDKDLGRVKKAYPNVMSIGKFMKQFD